ncbi:MAG TPA: hypothetical protein DCR84_07695 [Ruminococcaceae bacterium]|nr:hypothetical protein [Oscillospiraceae bacterium]
MACLPFRPPGLINRQAAGGKGIFAGSCPALRLLFSTGGCAVFCASISFMVYALPCVLPAHHGAVWHTIPYFSIQEKFYFTFRKVLSACIPMV